MLYGPRVFPCVSARVENGAHRSHQHAGNDADDDAFARGFSVCAQFAVSFAVEYYGDYCAEHSGAQHRHVAALLLHEAEDRADDQRDADGYREGDGQAGHVYRCHQQQDSPD